MALKRGISYQWRMFVPVLAAFWFIIISMAWWQIYRIREIRKEMVNDQMAVVGMRVYDFLKRDDIAGAEEFVTFINNYYENTNDYDPMTVRVRDADGTDLLNIGGILPAGFVIPKESDQGIIHLDGSRLENNDYGNVYLYHRIHTPKGRNVLVMLPYTKEVGEVLSASTTRFWLIFLSIAIFVTIFSYISSSYFGRNIKVLRNFAMHVADNPNFTIEDLDDLPHDELGEISRQIISLYRQRAEEYEKRELEHRVALHAIEEKNRIKRELTSNINHELKTPVGVIQGYIDTMVDNPDMDIETRDKFLYKTQENVHRLTNLINDITAITKLESGGKLVNVAPINFLDFVFTFANYLEESNVLMDKMTFTYDVPLGCQVFGNENLLQSVLLNFVKNAVAYSGGTECRLEMVKEDEDMAYFRFFDNGVGVPPESLPHMFERFFRVNAGRSRSAGGTGLGLTIVKVAIESFGGEIEACNRYPSGLQFDFSIPKNHKAIPTKKP